VSAARAVCAILAAGTSSRMGQREVIVAGRRRRRSSRARFEAAAAFPRVLVASPELAARVPAEPGLTVIVNHAPARGMAHSLALADAAISDRDAALVVLLGDTPLVDAALIAARRGRAW
jgi:CTP:molybdopterin cytidylyltransferase MocA